MDRIVELEGRWEDVVRKASVLRGRNVRMILMTQPDETLPSDNARHQAPDDPFTAAMRQIEASAATLGRDLDDSRDSVYGGTVDDPR